MPLATLFNEEGKEMSKEQNRRPIKDRKFLLESLGIDTKEYSGLPAWADFHDDPKMTKLLKKVISLAIKNSEKKLRAKRGR